MTGPRVVWVRNEDVTRDCRGAVGALGALLDIAVNEEGFEAADACAPDNRGPGAVHMSVGRDRPGGEAYHESAAVFLFLF